MKHIFILVLALLLPIMALAADKVDEDRLIAQLKTLENREFKSDVLEKLVGFSPDLISTTTRGKVVMAMTEYKIIGDVDIKDGSTVAYWFIRETKERIVTIVGIKRTKENGNVIFKGIIVPRD